MDSVPGYNINNAYIRQIKAMFQARKGSKNTRLKAMDEFLQVELEAGRWKPWDMERSLLKNPIQMPVKHGCEAYSIPIH